MGYGRKIYDKARAQLDRSRQEAESIADRKKEAFYTRCPEAQAIKDKMGATAAQAGKAVLLGANARAELEKLRDKNLALQAEFDRLLRQHGFLPDDLVPPYSCPVCKDTGFVDGRMCSCLRQLQRSLAYEALSLNAPLEKSTFESFSLDYFAGDPRALEQMEKVLQACRNYAEHFRPDSPSLLFKGATGLGKTHLSLAIAGRVIEKGYGVLYGSAHTFATALERERFDTPDPDDPSDANSQLLGCDLLILDDLGTEVPSQYVNAALYHVVNSRLLTGKPTIISTNLSMKEMEDRYTGRFASRIAGFYGMLEFIGQDVRIQRRRQKK